MLLNLDLEKKLVPVQSKSYSSSISVILALFNQVQQNHYFILRFTFYPRSKKKRSYGFATFKKKLIGKRRHCKGNDHGRCFREHFVDCPSDTLKALSSQYEALTMLRDLSVQANLARPPAATLGQSLAELFVSGCCSDIDLVYRGHRIPAHRTILMARCPYFRYVCKIFSLDSFFTPYYL